MSKSKDGQTSKADRRVEMIHPANLIPYARNAKKHDEQQVAKIAGSIREFGFNNPVLIDQDNGIIAGHGRVMAALKLGLEEVPVIRLTHLSDIQRRAYILADNKLAELGGGWDEEMLKVELEAVKESDLDHLLIGFTEEELTELLKEDTELNGDPDEVPEAPEDPTTKPGDLWILGDHRLLCGDSTKADDVARLMEGRKADCVFTSPPYAVGLDYGDTYTDSIGNLRQMLPLLASLWKIVITDGGFAVINFGDVAPAAAITSEKRPCEYPMAIEYWPVFRDAGWRLWSRRVWCKPNPRVHSLQCISSNRAATDFEHIWTWTIGKTPILGRVDGDMRSCLGWCDTSSMKGVDIGKDTHGAGMSLGIALWMINVHSRTGAVVHEPFCGTGTTLIAAEQLGRKCYGMEISPAYCDVIVKRWETLTGKKATLEPR